MSPGATGSVSLRPCLVDRELRARSEARDGGMGGLEGAPERRDRGRLGDLDGDARTQLVLQRREEEDVDFHPGDLTRGASRRRIAGRRIHGGRTSRGKDGARDGRGQGHRAGHRATARGGRRSRGGGRAQGERRRGRRGRDPEGRRLGVGRPPRRRGRRLRRDGRRAGRAPGPARRHPREQRGDRRADSLRRRRTLGRGLAEDPGRESHGHVARLPRGAAVPARRRAHREPLVGDGAIRSGRDGRLQRVQARRHRAHAHARPGARSAEDHGERRVPGLGRHGHGALGDRPHGQDHAEERGRGLRDSPRRWRLSARSSRRPRSRASSRISRLPRRRT